MAQQLKRLTPRKINAISKPGRHADGGGLYLVVAPSGTKQWAFMWKREGKRREMGLGAYHTVSLAEARDLADEARAVVAKGNDPIANRNQRRAGTTTAPTFGQCADEFLKTMCPQFRSEKHAEQWAMTLNKYCQPIRDIPVDQVSTDDVLAILKPIWSRIPETASRLRGRIERVLDAAKARGLRSGENPARWRGHLDHLLPARQKLTRGHHPALAYQHVPEFIAALRERADVSARLLEFIILTAVRLSDAREAVWREFDLDNSIWIIPAQRHKSGREFRVPLVGQAIHVLNDMAQQSGGSTEDAFVFPGQRKGRPLSIMTCDMLLRRMGKGNTGDDAPPWTNLTTHGFRSSFRDWAGEETSFPREVAEAALAHVVGDQTERAYRRGDALERRRELMQAWANYCEQGGAGNVFQLGAHNPH